MVYSCSMNVIAVTAVIVNEYNEILIQLRDDGNGVSIPYPNMWTLFGGTLEGSESLLGCLIREMKEELDIILSEDQCREFHSYNHDGGEDHVLLCRIQKDTPMELHEGREKKWVTFDELKTLSLAWHQEEILDEIENIITGDDIFRHQSN